MAADDPPPLAEPSPGPEMAAPAPPGAGAATSRELRRLIDPLEAVAKVPRCWLPEAVGAAGAPEPRRGSVAPEWRA